jgi:Fe-S-cluster containining protein
MNQLASAARAVMAIYHDIDREVAAFQKESGLACPKFCGRCCDSQKVEATILECLPLALTLFAAGEGEATLDAIETLEDKRCLFYEPRHEARQSWGCGRYETRPLICRMFGFAGNPDRLGRPRLSLCRVMKSAFSLGEGDEYRLASAQMPVFHEAALRLAALHPVYGARLLPINLALREALLKVAALRYLDAMKEQSENASSQAA